MAVARQFITSMPFTPARSYSSMLDQLLDSSLAISLKTPLVLLILMVLEAVLSADNAIALASIAQGLDCPQQQRRALNVGLIIAYGLRVLLILTASFILKYWQFELAGALYLLWLAGNYFISGDGGDDAHQNLSFTSFWQAIPIIAFTDIAFSLDSVTTAIAIADDIWLVLIGGAIGVLTLRFLAELFIRWLDIFTHLKDAGFITVGLVGLRLLIRVFDSALVPPEWLMISVIAVLFTWGFSERRMVAAESTETMSKKSP